MNNKSAFRRWTIILTLVFAGEMIFSLPFHLPRFYRATYLPAFGVNNTELGDAIAIYGIMAILAYFPGGILADRYSARKLITFSLLATSLGGFYLYTLPGLTGLAIVYGYWGVTTIFLFWAAMIKATREWGGHFDQGKAFGILEGGRGLVAAGGATLGVFLLSLYIPEGITVINNEERKAAIQSVIFLYSASNLGAAILVWMILPSRDKGFSPVRKNPFEGVIQVVRTPAVWLQALIVVFAYCGFKAIDYYGLYATEVLNMNELSAARFVSGTAYIRVVAPVLAGLLADRFSGTGVVAVLFALLTISFFLLSSLIPGEFITRFIFANLVIAIGSVYALRGVYFTLLEETHIKRNLTGTAVGIISVIGFTPDAFFNSLAGRIIDAKPGLEGFQSFYHMLFIFSIAGLVTTVITLRIRKKA